MELKVIHPSEADKLQQHILKSLNHKNIQSLGFTPDKKHIEAQTIKDPDYNEELLIGVFESEKIVASAMAVKRNSVKIAYIKWILVDPLYKKQGLGLSLYNNLMEKLKALKIDEIQFGVSVPTYFLPGIPTESLALLTMLINRGWKLKEKRVSILANINDNNLEYSQLSILPSSNTKFVVSCVSNNSNKKLVDFVNQEFPGPWSSEVEMAISGTNTYSGAVYASDSITGEVIGFAAFNGSNPNWFGPMGVKPAIHNSGIGRVLFFEALKEMKKMGLSEIMIPWINGKEQFYCRFFKKTKVLYYNFVSKNCQC